jgi:GGDEF domain-containing protein
LVVARDVTTDSLEHLANRCRQVLAEIAVPVKDRHVTASVSIGPALLKKGESSTNALVRADRLLYLNKRVGKNWMR